MESSKLVLTINLEEEGHMLRASARKHVLVCFGMYPNMLMKVPARCGCACPIKAYGRESWQDREVQHETMPLDMLKR